MFDTNLQDFLDRNGACSDGVDRLQSLSVETLEQAWDKASEEDLIWAVTRPGVMNPEQRRLFLVMVLESIEDKLTEPRSLNILTKLRTNEPITDNDSSAACKTAWNFCSPQYAVAWAAYAAARAADANATTWALYDSAKALWDVSRGASWGGGLCSTQANWVRENFKLCDLNTK